MAEPIVPLHRAIQAGMGYENDLLINLTDLLKNAFLNEEQLRPYAPKYIYINSPKSADLEELPSLHIWCPRTVPLRRSLGGQTGDKLTTHFQHFINIEYVYHDEDAERAAMIVNQVSSALFDVLNEHLNLNGLANGDNGVFETIRGDGFYSVKQNVKLLAKCTIHAVYARSYKKRTATR